MGNVCCEECLLQDTSSSGQVQVKDMEDVVIMDKEAAEVFLDKITSQPITEYRK